MRVDPKILKDEFESNLSLEEIDKLGVNHAAGSDHYRAYVGPPSYYDLHAALQFQLLSQLGLREYHRFLEVGCGSLRLGRLLITYLLSNRYFGIEPNAKILNEGSQHNLGSPIGKGSLHKLKQPTFKISADFNYSFTGGNIDFAIAQSIASHTGPKEFKELLKALYDCTNDNSKTIVTYIRCRNPDREIKKNGWFYPDCVPYTEFTVSNIIRSVGFKGYKIGWPVLNRRPDGLISTQQPILLVKNMWEPSAIDYLNAGFFNSVEPI